MDRLFRRFLSPARVAVLALMLVSFYQAVTVWSGGRVHNNDFKHLWAGTRILAEGGDPYSPDIMLMAARQYDLGPINPFVYLPATGLIMRPMAAVSFPTAAAIWFWANWILAWVCVLAGPALLRVDRRDMARIAGAAFLVGSLPFYRQMTAGQMNVVLLACLLGCAGLMIRGRDWPAGLVLGFAAAFKISPLYLIVVLALIGRKKVAPGGLLSFGAICLAAVLWAGIDVHHSAMPVLTSMGYGKSTWESLGMDFYRDPFNQSFNSLFHHLFTENPYTRPWIDLGAGAANLLTWGVSVALLGLLGRFLLQFHLGEKKLDKLFKALGARDLVGQELAAHLADSSGSLVRSYFIANILLMLLLPSLMWDHYAVQALIALMWVFGSRHLLHQPVLCILMVVVFGLLTWPWAHTAPAWSEGFGILLMSIRLWGTVGLLILVYCDFSRRFSEEAADDSRAQV